MVVSGNVARGSRRNPHCQKNKAGDYSRVERYAQEYRAGIGTVGEAYGDAVIVGREGCSPEMTPTPFPPFPRFPPGNKIESFLSMYYTE